MEIIEAGEKVITKPEFHPLLSAAWQSPDLEPPEVTSTPGLLFARRIVSEQSGFAQSFRQNGRHCERGMKIEVNRISLQTVVSHRMAAHDQEWNCRLLQCINELEEPFGRSHKTESSQPRLPWLSSVLIRKCPRNSSSGSELFTSATISS